MRNKTGELFFILPLTILVFIIMWGIISVLFSIVEDKNTDRAGEYKDFKEYKERTAILEGKVSKAEKEKKFLGSDEYNLVVNNNKGISKVVKVDEELYRNYQAGANVKFRIDKNASNEVVLDLNKEKDIKNEKEFKKKFENKLDSWFDDWRGKKSS